MPRYNEPDTGGTSTGAPPAPPVAPPLPPGVPIPPPTAVPAAPGLRGVARWNALQQTRPGVFSGPSGYVDWLKSLPDDPNDPEYQHYLDDARKRAFAGEGNPVEKVKAYDQAVNEYVTGTRRGMVKRDKEANPVVTPGSGAPGPSAQSATPYVAEGEKAKQSEFAEARDLENERVNKNKTRKTTLGAYWKQPTFKGRPVGTDELYTEGNVQDPYLQGFLSENGIQLTGDQQNKALRSGKYVYMGTEHNDELNVDRPVYMFTDDAQAASMHVDAAVLSGYQKALGSEVTGHMDPYMLSVWDKAVEMASRDTQASDASHHPMSVREWFDILMQSAIAQKKAGAAGGGVQYEEFDYYKAMMQVLGDISGVGNA